MRPYEWISTGLLLCLAIYALVALTGGTARAEQAVRNMPPQLAITRPVLEADRIRLAVDAVEPITLHTIFPGGYGTLMRPSVSGDPVEAPALLISVVPIGDYRAYMQQFMDRLLVPGSTIGVVGSGTGIGNLREMPVIEVWLAEGQTLSERLVSDGLAVPRSDLLDSHFRKGPLIEALKEARARHRGYWGEATASVQAVPISAEVALATQPPLEPPSTAKSLGLVLVLAMVLAAAWRETQWRSFEEEQRKHGKPWKESTLGWSSRIALAVPTAGLFNFFLRPGLGRTLTPSASVPDESPSTTEAIDDPETADKTPPAKEKPAS